VAFWGRRERPPAEIVASLDRDERVVSWADAADGAVVLATSRGVWWPDPAGPRRILWQHIDKVTWRDAELTVVEADLVDDFLLVDRPPVRVTLTKPRDLPPTVRKRVEANIVRRERASVGGGTVWFVGRRQPGRDGLAWWARLDPGTERSEPVLSAVRARLETLRASDDSR
jgi:hypothetical protein